MVSDNYHKMLVELGARLRAKRLEQNEPQARFAARIGISIPTLRRLEQGDASAQIGHWLGALDVLGRLHEVDALLGASASLFVAAEPAPPLRQRTRRRLKVSP